MLTTNFPCGPLPAPRTNLLSALPEAMDAADSATNLECLVVQP